MDPSAPGWYPDPTGRNERRYWSGIRWSRHVDNGGQRADDPIAPDSRETAAVPPPQGSSQYPAMYGGYPPPRRRLVMVLGVVVALLAIAGGALALTSRGGGDDDTTGGIETDDPLTAYLIGFAKRATGDTVTDNQASCMATNVIDVLGRDRLVEADLLQLDNPLTVLTPEEAETWIKTSYDCLDEQELVAAMAATWNPERFGGLPDEIAPCIYRGWIQGWGRSRAIEIFGKLANPEKAPDPATILTKQENDLMTKVIGECNATLHASTTAG